MAMEQSLTGTPDGKGPALPGQVVLVLQGGGAVGAYQAGYEALHEAAIEPAHLQSSGS